MAVVGDGGDPHPMAPRRWACLATLGVILAAACLLPAPVAAAPPNQLSAPSVGPSAGTTATTFTFTVNYEGRDPAVAVVALVAGRTVDLALTSGTATAGTFRGQSMLPVGTWQVTFAAYPARGNQPTADGGLVQVAAPAPTPPPPTSAPTPPPVVLTPPPPTPPPPAGAPPPPAPAAGAPAPAEAPSEPPAAAESSTGPTAPSGGSGAPDAAIVGVPVGAVFSPTPSEGAGIAGSFRADPVRSADAVVPILLGGLGIIGLVAAWGILVGAPRRRRELAAVGVMSADPPAAAGLPADAERTRAAAAWEIDAQLEDETIGTVDYLPLEDGEAVGSPPPDVPAAPPPKRTNPRVARMEAAKSSRRATARRGALERD